MSEKKVAFKVGDKEYSIAAPNLEQQREGQKVYNRAFADAISSGAMVRASIDSFMRKQKLWNDEKEKEFLDIQNKTLAAEKKLQKGGIKLSEAKKVALKLNDLRREMRELISVKSNLDVNTAEGQADNERFNYLVSVCLVYNNSGKPVYDSVDSYLKAGADEVAIKGAESLAKLLYNLDSDFEHKLPENQFLKEFGFVNDDLRLINEAGDFVDAEGRLVNEEGRYIDKEGNFVDKEGNPLDEDGNYAFERKPFLDDDGKEIAKKESQPEEELVDAAEPDPTQQEVAEA